MKFPAQSGRVRTLIHPGPVSGVHVRQAMPPRPAQTRPRHLLRCGRWDTAGHQDAHRSRRCNALRFVTTRCAGYCCRWLTWPLPARPLHHGSRSILTMAHAEAHRHHVSQIACFHPFDRCCTPQATDDCQSGHGVSMHEGEVPGWAVTSRPWQPHTLLSAELVGLHI